MYPQLGFRPDGPLRFETFHRRLDLFCRMTVRHQQPGAVVVEARLRIRAAGSGRRQRGAAAGGSP